MAQTLTLRQKEILLLLNKYIVEHGYAPSVRELCTLAGLKSTNAIDDHLCVLQEKGYIARQPKIARSMRVLMLPEEKKTE
jgi:repressor LexA